MCGRIKDMIIVGGRNVYPQDIETAVATVDGVRAGNVIAFGVDGRHGREAIVVVAESKATDPEPVRRLVAATVREAVGVPPREVVLVAPGSLPEDELGEAPEVAVQGAVSRRSPPTRVGAADGSEDVGGERARRRTRTHVDGDPHGRSRQRRRGRSVFRSGWVRRVDATGASCGRNG